jgi:hypothetical protein
LAYEYHIAPSQLLNESPRMLVTLQRYLRWRNVQERNAQKGGK